MRNKLRLLKAVPSCLIAKTFNVLLITTLLAGVVLYVLPVPVAYADTYDVSNTNDTGDGSLRKAITDANANPGHDTITFSTSGTITLGSALPQITDDVTITGPGADTLSISGADSYRVFQIASSTAVTITGVTVQNGNSDWGAGIYNKGTLNISHCTLSGNTASIGGGGISNEYGAVNISNSTVSGNSASVGGGGILNVTTTMNITNCTLSNNTAPAGGGILNDGTLNISNSTLSSNTGVGIYNFGGTLNISNSTVSGNTGRGISNHIGTVNIINSTVSGNTGGGISNSGDRPHIMGTLNISNSTISGNTATDWGGGISNEYGRVKSSNCTFHGNSASVGGGGIHNSNQGTVEMQNTIITESTGGDCTSTTSGAFSGSNNLIDEHDSGACSGISTAGVTNLAGNLQDNGGLTFTHALQAGSNAIDAVTDCTYISSGDNPLFEDGETITTDQRGVSRPQPPGGDCDIGAYELERGTIIIEKQTNPAGGTGFGFTHDIGGGGSFNLDDGSPPKTFNDVLPGQYTVTEDDPTPAFDLTSITCDDGSSAIPSTWYVVTRTATINLDPGETVTCTFTNTQRGHVIVEKQTDPDAVPGTFTFSGDAAGTISDDGQIVVRNLVPETYTAIEDDPTPAFDLTAISCDDGSSTTPSTWDVGTRTATFQLDPGETVKCAFTNTLLTSPTGYSSDLDGVGKDTYTTREAVYATGSDFVPNTYVDVYIVGDLAWSDGMAIPPDVSRDGMDTVLTDAIGNLGPTLVWPPPLTVGEYDMVFDANRNGVYDEVFDVVDHPAHPGFAVQEPVPIGGIIVPVNRLELLAPWLGLVAVASLGAVAFAFWVQRNSARCS